MVLTQQAQVDLNRHFVSASNGTSRLENNFVAEMCSDSEAGLDLRPIDVCFTEL